VERTEEETFPADAAALRDIRTFIRDRATQDGVPESATDDIVLAVSEASTNAIVHTSTGEIVVRWRKQEGLIYVWVCDEGIFRDAVGTPQLEGLGGRGIPLMQALMDAVTFRRGTTRQPGTIVCMAKRI
jgi:anti-sigma regulatory factor (Ser/Thr protein kinase)